MDTKLMQLAKFFNIPTFTTSAILILVMMLSFFRISTYSVVPIATAGENRVAWVIGNNEYEHLRKLKNAVADADFFHRELKKRGFMVVYHNDATREQMYAGMKEFVEKLSNDSIGVIYYSGHGLQINGSNYLLPTDLEANNESDVKRNGVVLENLLEDISPKQAKFILAIIDACRDNPLENTKGVGDNKGLSAPTLGNANGIMIVYAAGIGQKAIDRLNNTDTNPNGLFTREFAKVMNHPGLSIQEVVWKVKQSVIAKAMSIGKKQTPAIYDQSTGTFYFTSPEPPIIIDPPPPETKYDAVVLTPSLEPAKNCNVSCGLIKGFTTESCNSNCGPGQTGHCECVDCGPSIAGYYTPQCPKCGCN